MNQRYKVVGVRILNLDGHFFVKSFRKLGHDVLWLGSTPNCDIRLDKTLSLAELLSLLKSRDFRPDLVVWADLCKPPSVIGIEQLPAVTVGYSIDQYCNPWHTLYGAAFDLMLIAQKDYLQGFKDERIGHRLEWQPLFCDSHKDINEGKDRDIPVSFVGTVTGSINKERKAFLDNFKQSHPIFVTQGNYVPIYNRSQIVVNQSAVGELNFRIFEAMACGAVMLTEDTSNGLHDLFAEDELLVYPRGNPAAAAQIARQALKDPDKLAEMAINGRRKVVNNHSSLIRARHILKKTEEIMASGLTWRKQKPKAALKRVGCAYSMLAVDTENNLPHDLREFYASIGQNMMNKAK